ncbi:CYTH and CHAD domain-containing protein [Aquariibacter albus]|uniref:CHAD domain-containing protein n=1 Tax=Aquariibacter albus TaxID=2759899 RepID=A0A839HJW5_9BURK|nr:CHAD domain-containing protein [Aquariibacter albus]MBB1162333.1 CHAD domain-containing protein [Aquariibacter albus]
MPRPSAAPSPALTPALTPAAPSAPGVPSARPGRRARPAAAPVEIELRLQIPPAAREAVRAFLREDGGSAQSLKAVYLDTPDRLLARHAMALRLRKEGRQWVQTLKCGAAHALVRGEHNVPLPAVPGGGQPPVDPQRHAGQAVGDQLLALLDAAARHQGPAAVGLVEGFVTDIQRRSRRQRLRHGTVEFSLDEGELRAPDGAGGWRIWPVCELEIELLGGSPRAVFEAARRWTARGLWLEPRSKAERGERLRRGGGPGQPGPAFGAQPLKLPRGAEVSTLAGAALDNVAAQVLRNAGELCGGAAGAESLHQLRVGLRRLRSLDRLRAGWPGVAPIAAGPALAALFRRLGAARDADALGEGLGAELAAAWAQAQGLAGPPAGFLARAAPAEAVPDPVAELRAAPAQQALLLLLAQSALPAERIAPMLADWTRERARPAAPADRADPAPAAPAAPSQPPAPADLTPAPDPSARAQASARLARWQRRLVREVQAFDRLDDEARHALRKALKRQRYCVELCAGLYGRKPLAAYLKPLRAAQEALGAFNDVCVATAHARAAAEAGQAEGWFALGWLQPRRAQVLAEAGRCLQRFRKAPPPWA